VLVHAQTSSVSSDNDLREERAREVLTELGVNNFNRTRLHQLRGAMDNPASVWFCHPREDKNIIEQAITDLIGLPEPIHANAAKPRKRKRKAKVMDFSKIDCDPRLLDILVNCFPHRPYCSSLDGYVDNCPRDLDVALTKNKIQYNPPGFKSFVVVDVDYAVSTDEWKDAGLPPPTWISINPKNGHGHFVWALSPSATVWADGDNQKPARWFNAIQEAYRAALSGDAGFSHTLTKNPVSTAWRTSSPSDYAMYDLAELDKHVELKKVKQPKEIQEGSMRNCMLFDITREWAYREVARHADSLSFGAEVQYHVESLNSGLLKPLGSNETIGIGRSISRWTWRHRHELAQGYSDSQAARGRKSGKVRADKRAPDMLEARLLRNSGHTTTQIAAKFDVDARTVRRWLN